MSMKILFALLLLGRLAPAEAQTVRVKLHSTVGYGPHEEFAKRAAAAFERALNSPAFEPRMMGKTYLRTKGLANRQLFELIKRAHEEAGAGGEDGVVDLRARILRIDADEAYWRDKCALDSRAGTIGIDGNADGITAICPQRLEEWAKNGQVWELAGHYAHEYMHQIGFDHSNWRRGQAWREKTLVYQIGDLVADLVEEESKK